MYKSGLSSHAPSEKKIILIHIVLNNLLIYRLVISFHVHYRFINLYLYTT